jgi:hypothetical protein
MATSRKQIAIRFFTGASFQRERKASGILNRRQVKRKETPQVSTPVAEVAIAIMAASRIKSYDKERSVHNFSGTIRA